VPLDIGLSFAREFKMDAINPQYKLLRDNTTELMAQIREANLRTVVWDVNSAEEIEAIAAAGADAIITNDPRMARAVLDQP
jgi:glycerophosphoryl diester phosphodiesterase